MKSFWIVILLVGIVLSSEILSSSELLNVIAQQRANAEFAQKLSQETADAAVYAMFDAYCTRHADDVKSVIVELQRAMVAGNGETKDKVDEELALCVMEMFINNSFCVSYDTDSKNMRIQTKTFLVPLGERSTMIVSSVLFVNFRIFFSSNRVFFPFPLNARELSASAVKAYFEYLHSDRAAPSVLTSVYCSVFNCYMLG